MPHHVGGPDKRKARVRDFEHLWQKSIQHAEYLRAQDIQQPGDYQHIIDSMPQKKFVDAFLGSVDEFTMMSFLAGAENESLKRAWDQSKGLGGAAFIAGNIGPKGILKGLGKLGGAAGKGVGKTVGYVGESLRQLFQTPPSKLIPGGESLKGLFRDPAKDPKFMGPILEYKGQQLTVNEIDDILDRMQSGAMEYNSQLHDMLLRQRQEVAATFGNDVLPPVGTASDALADEIDNLPPPMLRLPSGEQPRGLLGPGEQPRGYFRKTLSKPSLNSYDSLYGGLHSGETGLGNIDQAYDNKLISENQAEELYHKWYDVNPGHSDTSPMSEELFRNLSNDELSKLYDEAFNDPNFDPDKLDDIAAELNDRGLADSIARGLGIDEPQPKGLLPPYSQDATRRIKELEQRLRDQGVDVGGLEIDMGSPPDDEWLELLEGYVGDDNAIFDLKNALNAGADEARWRNELQDLLEDIGESDLDAFESHLDGLFGEGKINRDEFNEYMRQAWLNATGEVPSRTRREISVWTSQT